MENLVTNFQSIYTQILSVGVFIITIFFLRAIFISPKSRTQKLKNNPKRRTIKL